MKTMKHCDFCGRATRDDRLQLWPCGSFDLIHVQHEGTLSIACECHTLETVPPGGTVTFRHGMVGSWAACPDCRADVDAERWDVIASRMVAETRRLERPLTATTARAMAEMFKVHRTPPGETRVRWRPYSAAVSGAEQLIYNLDQQAP